MRDMGFYLVSVLLILLFFWDGQMLMWEAGLLGAVYIVYLVCVGKWSKWLNYSIPPLQKEEGDVSKIATWAHQYRYTSFLL